MFQFNFLPFYLGCFVPILWFVIFFCLLMLIVFRFSILLWIPLVLSCILKVRIEIFLSVGSQWSPLPFFFFSFFDGSGRRPLSSQVQLGMSDLSWDAITLRTAGLSRRCVIWTFFPYFLLVYTPHPCSTPINSQQLPFTFCSLPAPSFKDLVSRCVDTSSRCQDQSLTFSGQLYLPEWQNTKPGHHLPRNLHPNI